MTQAVIIRRLDNTARAATTGSALPTVVITHLAQFTLAAAFTTAADSSVIAPLGGTVASVRCVVKETPTAAVLLMDADMPLTGSGTAARYNAVWDDADVDSAALRSFLGAELERSAFMEIEWTVDGSTERCAFPITIRAAFFLPTDAAPNPAADASLTWLAANAIRYYPAITALTGGGSTALDGVPTLTLAARTLIQILRTVDSLPRLEIWHLAAGTDAEDAASGIVRPDDYHATTNAKIWKQLS